MMMRLHHQIILISKISECFPGENSLRLLLISIMVYLKFSFAKWIPKWINGKNDDDVDHIGYR